MQVDPVEAYALRLIGDVAGLCQRDRKVHERRQTPQDCDRTLETYLSKAHSMSQ